MMSDYVDCELYLTGEDRAVLKMDGRREHPGRPALGETLRRRLLAASLDPTTYGTLLFDALFRGDGEALLTGYREALTLARHDEKRLRLRLHLAPEAPTALHEVDWELLYDPSKKIAFGRSQETAFSRYLSVSREAPPPVEGTPRLLVAIAAPEDLDEYSLPKIDRDQVRASIERTLERLAGQISYEILEPPVTTVRLRERLRDGVELLHLVSHGCRHTSDAVASLVLEDADARACFVGPELLEGIVEGDRHLRLVNLVACHSDAAATDPFSGLGTALVGAGVPAVVAMRRSISLDAATRFTEHLFHDLAACGRIDAALNEARQRLYLAAPNSREWATPTLYMRLADGRLWQTDPQVSTSPRPSAPVSLFEGRFVAGTVLADRYRIVELIARGGMGEVYKAQDLLLKLPVALKLLPEAAEQDAQKREELLAEVKIARLVNDDHVCRLHDVGRHVGDDGETFHFITMEYVDGSTLAELLGKVPRLPEETVVERALELCQGLAAIHAKGVLHRDFKPSNVMIDKQGRARITDFGLAVSQAEAVDTGRIAGTLAYMAPEQMGGTAWMESDLYALGLVLYEMLTGRPPFAVPPRDLDPDKRLRTLHRLRQAGKPPPPSASVGPLEQSSLERVILRCLEARREDRFPSAQAVAAELEGKAAPSGPPGQHASGSTTWPGRPTRPTRSEDPVRGWLDCMKDDHRNLLPFFEGGQEVILDEVYVELRMTAKNARRMEEYQGQPLSLPNLLRDLDPAQHAWVTGRWLLRGDPGAGKTTLLRHFAAGLARDGGKPWVPLFASLPNWVRGREDLLAQADTRLARRGFAAGALHDVLVRRGEQGRLLFLLDGLDEVPRESRDEAAGLLHDLTRRWPKAPIVVTTRPIGSMKLGEGFVELDLLDFDAGQRRRFLQLWLDRTRGADNDQPADRWQRLIGHAPEDPEAPKTSEACAAELNILLDEDPGLRELASNPLYLTLMALLLENGDRPARNRTKLYDQVFELLFKGRHRLEGRPLPNRNSAQRALGFVAHGMTVDDHGTEPLDDLEERLLTPEASDLRQRLAAEERWKRPLVFLEDVGNHTSILGPHDGPLADWRFWHRTFREALTAEELERRGVMEALDDAMRFSVDEGRWAEPYALLAGRLEQPDELVLALMKANRSLVCVPQPPSRGYKTRRWTRFWSSPRKTTQISRRRMSRK